MKINQPISLYMHIPFCQKKCAYCDFLSFDGQAHHIDAYMAVLVEEIKSFGEKNKCEVRSVFIGGGTPSVLPVAHMNQLFNTILEAFVLAPSCEVTMEINPGTLDEKKIDGLKSSAVNRVSLGVQSMDIGRLKTMGRIHVPTDFLRSYEALRAAGFTNINLDMIYGLPGQSLAMFQGELEAVIALQPEHLSVYGLSIEPGTPFASWYEKNPEAFCDEDTDRAMYWYAHDRLEQAGYTHYEISNYAKAGFESVHNQVYWTLEPYVGFGLGAASYMAGVRYLNIKDLKAYCASDGAVIDPESYEPIDPKKAMEEYLFLGLRLLKGVDLTQFKQRFQVDFEAIYGDVTRPLVQKGLLTMDGVRLKLTKQGIDLSNRVMAEFLLD